MQQLFPNPDLDPGFRLGPDGRARFLHEGHTVHLHVRPATAEDDPWYKADEIRSNDIMMICTIIESEVELVRIERPADWSEPYQVRETLDEMLRDSVEEARWKVDKLVERLAAVARKRKEGKA